MKYIFLLMAISCSHNSSEVIHSKKFNKHLDRPYVLLISLDGYRHDYTQKFKPPFLTKFKQSGASLVSLRPSFPTKTYPNHLSIITGSYPMNHGIVANSFYDPNLKIEYKLSNRAAVKDGRFYTRKPLWVLAEEQGLKTADFYWPGGETLIHGHKPSYYFPYDHGAGHNQRVNQIKKWLSLPEKLRPHLITLYFHDIDTAGHIYGPDSKEVKQAILKVDNSLGKIFKSLKGLNINLNSIIVSDHGMNNLSEFKQISILNSKTKNFLKRFKIIGKGPVMHLYRNDPIVELSKALQILNTDPLKYECYDKETTPDKLNFKSNERIGDIVCIANKGFSIYESIPYLSNGGHGWSQFDGKDMHGIFYANGPAFKKQFSFKTQSNIHIYPVLAKILKLEIKHKIDGKLQSMKKLLRKK